MALIPSELELQRVFVKRSFQLLQLRLYDFELGKMHVQNINRHIGVWLTFLKSWLALRNPSSCRHLVELQRREIEEEIERVKVGFVCCLRFFCFVFSGVFWKTVLDHKPPPFGEDTATCLTVAAQVLVSPELVSGLRYA